MPRGAGYVARRVKCTDVARDFSTPLTQMHTVPLPIPVIPANSRYFASLRDRPSFVLSFHQFFDFPNDGVDRISHVGIVVKDNGDGTVTCIEGNTAPDKKGDQRNGGQVCLKVRAYKKKNGSKLRKSQPVAVVGFGKPVFKS